MHSGPNIKREGLLFGYDTGAVGSSNPNFSKHLPHKNKGKGAHRYYKGRATTNYIAYQNAVAQSSYTSYQPTTDATWLANHPKAIYAYNAGGSSITGYINSGVNSGNWTVTHHAHWQYDKQLKKPVVVMNCFDSHWKAKSYDCNTNAWNTYGLATGDKYVISWLQWTTHTNKALSVGVYCKNTAGTRNFYDGRSSASDTTVLNTKKKTWQRVYKVYTITSTHDITQDYERIYMYGHSNGPNGDGVVIKIADVQLELGVDHPSAFLDMEAGSNSTTRSSTEGLIDLKRSRNLDTSNVSYDSNGLLSFDGTDDGVQTTTGINLSGYSAVSYEAVFKGAGAGTYDRWFSGTTGTSYHYPDLAIDSTGNLSYIHCNLLCSWTSTGVSVSTSDYNHIVFVFTNSGSVKLYVNGTLEYSATHSSGTFSTDSRFMVGNRYDRNGEGLIGEIPLMRIYGEELSSRRIKQNYLGYKNRFNL